MFVWNCYLEVFGLGGSERFLKKKKLKFEVKLLKIGKK